jgi:hypothetical protein
MCGRNGACAESMGKDLSAALFLGGGQVLTLAHEGARG